MTIYEKENQLFESWSNCKSLDEGVVWDGLCWANIRDADMANGISHLDEHYESLWTESARKPLFFTKEPNGNDGEDYRDWHWEGKNSFVNVVSYWLQGLHQVSADYCPNLSKLQSIDDILAQYPLCLVNAKKTAGDDISDWKEIREAAHANQKYLYRHIREILKPNIIVCCGSNDDNDDNRKMLPLALDCLFPDEKDRFVKVNGWCHYNSELDILLIDSYHPSYRIAEEFKVNELLKSVHEFYKWKRLNS